MLGGASDRVPTLIVPGTTSPSAFTSIRSRGVVVAVVYRSSPAAAAAASRFVGTVAAAPTPGGEHRSREAALSESLPHAVEVHATRIASIARIHTLTDRDRAMWGA